jgi:metallo-beta-lactamase family protein
MLSVTFCGAARTVTGSQYYLEYTAPDQSTCKFCIDSGLFQTGQSMNLYKINSHLLFDPRSLDCIVLTHAHLDHCGRIPYLIKNGFGGKIYSTEATKKIAEVVMTDAARLSTAESDATSLAGLKKGENSLKHDNGDIELFQITKGLGERKVANITDGMPELTGEVDVDPKTLHLENMGLYNESHVEQAMTRFKTCKYHEPFQIHPNLQVEFFDAGHILGSAWLVITEISSGKQVAFSGDFGNINKPIIEDPEMPYENQRYFPGLTHAFIETTYGNRLHGKLDPKEKLRKVIGECVRNDGQVLLPAFSVERAQEVIYFIVELMQENKIPRVPIYLDSPMASKVLKICLEYPELYDEDYREKISAKADPLRFPLIEILESPGDSKKLNTITKPCIIIAGSGMITGGRILKHLYFHIENPNNTLLIVGYQGTGTLGRQILDGANEILLEGQPKKVMTKIEIINEFSAHADQKTLKDWIVNLFESRRNGHQTQPLTVFLMHGEKDASLAFGHEIESLLPNQVQSYWPHFGEKTQMWE